MKPPPGKSCPSCGERYDADVLFCPRDGTPLASSRSPSLSERDAYIGVEVPGQIRLDHLIGIGSMGRVYRAFQGGIERDVAVKVLHRELSGNNELVARFHREAKVASRLVHPNVVQVLMTGSLPASHDPKIGGELYLVMEHLDGISLLSALAAAGTDGEGAALPLPRALHIAVQICDAVGEAHAQNIVHRDIKPENVMLVRRGDDPDYVKVLDFGIARLDWGDRSMATQAGLIFGTAKYISPEGAEGQPVGPAADVYSIATMLYQMLAGRTPFEGDSPVALLVQHTHAPPVELRTIARASYVPAPLASVIMQNLAKKPADRAPNARQLGRDLVAAARASGLYPEEIATQALFSPASLGTVKLASKERTKSHELSAELAAKIGGVPAQRADRDEPKRGPATPRRATAEIEGPWTPPPSARVVEMAQGIEPRPSQIPHDVGSTGATPRSEITLPSGIPATRSGAPSSARAPRPSASARAAPPPDLDFDDAPSSSVPMPEPTIQGTETTLEDPTPSIRRPAPSRARATRIAVIAVACALVATPIAILGGRRLGGAGGSDATETSLEEARDCMRRRAWDSPPGRNFKEITGAALARSPVDARVVDLRREAAERIVSDALGRKYANDLPEARHLVHLALEMDPALTTAQHLAAELDGPRAPDVAPAPTTSASSGKKKPGRDARPEPKGAVDPRPPAASAPQPPPHPPPTGQPGAVLPQQQPPPDKPPPAPSSSGPWL